MSKVILQYRLKKKKSSMVISVIASYLVNIFKFAHLSIFFQYFPIRQYFSNIFKFVNIFRYF